MNTLKLSMICTCMPNRVQTGISVWVLNSNPDITVACKCIVKRPIVSIQVNILPSNKSHFNLASFFFFF